ncbi:MAG: hypoxanthine-guanine phosphoribosyltransferase [Pseudomonadota bacterium]
MTLSLPPSARVLVERDAVEAAYDRLAAEIAADYAGREILLLVVMNGGAVAAVHLAERLDLPVVLDYLHVTRYRGGTRGGVLHWVARPQQDLAGRHVLVVDDILDEGNTLAAILQHCRDAGAASVRSAVLVHKHHDRRIEGVAADYIGLDIDDHFIFGCGMDYEEGFRHLREIWAVEPA